MAKKWAHPSRVHIYQVVSFVSFFGPTSSLVINRELNPKLSSIVSPKREMASSKLVVFCSFLLTLVLLLAFQGAARELLDVASKFATMMIFSLIISFILKKIVCLLKTEQKLNTVTLDIIIQVIQMRIPIHIGCDFS